MTIIFILRTKKQKISWYKKKPGQSQLVFMVVACDSPYFVLKEK